MKHTFLLDENILYLAIKGVDQHDNEDATAAELLGLVAQNCHGIALHPELGDKYWRHLQRLLREPAPAVDPVRFIKQFMYNSEKARWELKALSPRDAIALAGEK